MAATTPTASRVISARLLAAVGAADIDRVRVLSDYRERSFGLSYGVLVKELLLLSRSIFVVDANDTISYIQHVAEIAEEPDYAAALEAAKGQIAVRELPANNICGGY